MSEFEAGLNAARRRQVRFYIGAFVALLLIGIVVLGALAATSGTAVRIAPDDAVAEGKVEVIDGLGLVVGGTVYSVSAPPIIAVRSPGFAEVIHPLTAEQLGATLTFELKPLPGRLIATTNPALNAVRWSLDGQSVAIGPQLDIEQEAGSYEIVADHPHFRSVRATVLLERGTLSERIIDLLPVEGQVSIDSEPQGAEIRIGDSVAGTTPAILDLEGGAYEITVTAPDRAPLEDTIEVTSTSPQVERRYILKPFGATGSVFAVPSGGQLLVDGQEVAEEEAIDVSAGEEHTITYMFDGYQPSRQTIKLARDEHRDLVIRLQERVGTVDIRTTGGAEIVLDGDVVGESEIELQLLARPHELEIRKPGYRPLRRTITPTDERPLVIHEDLVTERAATLAEAPGTYTNSAGMTMTLFKPGLFQMGAPRSEKGQRANEFLKTVRLTKPFYASRHEVTNAQYAQHSGDGKGPGKQPVTGVTWIEAASFANWLSENEDLQPVYQISAGQLQSFDQNANGYRLLTEAEWEWLARRAGKPEESVFPWGNSDTVPKGAGNIADENANGTAEVYVPNYNDGFAGAAPVGSFGPEASGLYDLTGNVSEWVHDYYSLVPPNQGALFVDPMGPNRGQMHTVKGASYLSGSRTWLRPASRRGLMTSSDEVGFRIGRYLHGNQAIAAE